MIEYEGNKLEDFIGDYLSVYKKKETDCSELENILNACLKDIENKKPDDVTDTEIENVLKSLLSKKFSGDSGMGLPMLSGFLSLRLPDHFVVIDIEVLESLYKLSKKDFFPKELRALIIKKWQNMRDKNKQLKKINSKDYINYLKIVRGIRKRISEGAASKDYPLEDIERALYAYNKYPKKNK